MLLTRISFTVNFLFRYCYYLFSGISRIVGLTCLKWQDVIFLREELLCIACCISIYEGREGWKWKGISYCVDTWHDLCSVGYPRFNIRRLARILHFLPPQFYMTAQASKKDGEELLAVCRPILQWLQLQAFAASRVHSCTAVCGSIFQVCSIRFISGDKRCAIFPWHCISIFKRNVYFSRVEV